MAMITTNKMCLALLIVIAQIAAAHGQTKVHIGTAPSIGAGATLIADARGYFKDVGVTVEMENLDSSANAIALLAQNRFQMVEGGISAGYFNALEKKMPVTIVMSRASSPLGHLLMLRSDLRDSIKTIKDLKGRVIATNGPGSVSTYEIGKILETAGLTLADVEIKVIPFSQYAIAFQNKAIDAGLAITPLTSQLRDKGFAYPFAESDVLVEPRPVTISVAMINTDWAKANPELARNFFIAYLRGVRDYCQAYHGSAIRQDMIDLLVRTGTERRPELLHQYPWPARNPDGKIFIDSLLDMQAWYLKNKFIIVSFSPERLVDSSYADLAAQTLGPFVLENKASNLAGCR